MGGTLQKCIQIQFLREVFCPVFCSISKILWINESLYEWLLQWENGKLVCQSLSQTVYQSAKKLKIKGFRQKYLAKAWEEWLVTRMSLFKKNKMHVT